MKKLVAITGLTGSGKTIVSDEFKKRNYEFIRFGQITLDIVREKGLEPTEENEKTIRENVRKEHGMGAFAILNLPKINNFLQKGNVCVDGLYSWSEYKILKEKFKDNFFLISVFSPPKLRYERLTNRKWDKEKDKKMINRPATIESAKARDYAEIENIEKGGPIAYADYTILNTKDIDFVYEQLKEIIQDIEK
jgi:dephospho-CoA kinase